MMTSWYVYRKVGEKYGVSLNLNSLIIYRSLQITSIYVILTKICNIYLKILQNINTKSGDFQRVHIAKTIVPLPKHNVVYYFDIIIIALTIIPHYFQIQIQFFFWDNQKAQIYGQQNKTIKSALQFQNTL